MGDVVFCEGGIRFYLFNFQFFLKKFFEIFEKKKILFRIPPSYKMTFPSPMSLSLQTS
jgi:hypothetical protein